MHILFKITFVIITTATLIFYIIGRKYLKKVKEGQVNNDEYYKKGIKYILIFFMFLLLSTILNGIFIFRM